MTVFNFEVGNIFELLQ